MAINLKFVHSIKITEVERIHDTHYMIRFGNQHYVKIYMSNESICCEKFGMEVNYQKSPALLEDIPLKGARLNGIKIAQTVLNGKYGEKRDKRIILFTSVGLVFISVFNEHNSYYPHNFEADIQTPEFSTTLQERL
jgi:hypothetical protein